MNHEMPSLSVHEHLSNAQCCAVVIVISGVAVVTVFVAVNTNAVPLVILGVLLRRSAHQLLVILDFLRVGIGVSLALIVLGGFFCCGPHCSQYCMSM